MTATILTGEVLEQLRTLPDASVQCCVTSPPYWGLRDYQVDGQIGLEPTPAAYVARMVEVFREVRRVLRDDGVCWLNLGDSYAGSGVHSASHANPGISKAGARGADVATPVPEGLKPKDLVGIPWRVAFALQDDGWWLRSDIIWAKPNPMPESVTDRPTKAHEYVFLLTKAQRYYYDAEAIAEPAGPGKVCGPKNDASRRDGDRTGIVRGNGVTRNARSVWTIATQPYPEAHFATFPEELPRRCILAGTSAHGCCPECGAPWERIIAKTNQPDSSAKGSKFDVSTGWRPTCSHDAAPIPCTVLDPFAGSGTTLAVALALGRHAIGIELNPEYVKLAERRIAGVTPALFGV